MSISVYTELYSETERFLSKSIPNEFLDIFKPGVEMFKSNLTLYFNGGTLIRFMAAILDVRV